MLLVTFGEEQKKKLELYVRQCHSLAQLDVFLKHHSMLKYVRVTV